MGTPRLTAVLVAVLLGLAGGFLPLRASASELGEFHSAVAGVFEPYRAARSYLRTESNDAAAFELEAMLAAWSALNERFGETPPDALSDDAQYAPVIARIGADGKAALEAIDAGNPADARALLEPLHGLMSDLRRRNGLYLLPDCLMDFSGAMDELWVFRHEMPDLSEVESKIKVLSRAAVVEYEAKRCEAMASGSLRADPEFRRLFDIFHEGIAPIRRGVIEESPARIINVLRELRSAQRLIFLRFG